MSMRTGAFAYAKYGWEGTFRGGATALDKVFCKGQRITTLDERHNLLPVYELGFREITDSQYGNFEGSVGIEGILSNPWFFRGLMGTVATSGTGPYTHTFTKTKTLPSAEIEIGFTGASGNVRNRLRGTVINSASIAATVGEMVTLSLDMFYSDSLKDTAVTTSIADTFVPFTAQYVSFEMPSGTVIGGVQSVELTIANNLIRVYEIGQFKPSNTIPQAFDVTGRANIILTDIGLLNNIRGLISTAKLKIQSSADNSITINMANLLFEDFALPFEPNAPVILSLPFRARDVTSVAAVNNVATAP